MRVSLSSCEGEELEVLVFVVDLGEVDGESFAVWGYTVWMRVC